MEKSKKELVSLIETFAPEFQDSEVSHFEELLKVGSRVVDASSEQISAAREYGKKKALLREVSEKVREMSDLIGDCPGHVFGYDTETGCGYYSRRCIFCGNSDLI